jgi:hypothetical protein
MCMRECKTANQAVFLCSDFNCTPSTIKQPKGRDERQLLDKPMTQQWAFYVSGIPV